MVNWIKASIESISNLFPLYFLILIIKLSIFCFLREKVANGILILFIGLFCFVCEMYVRIERKNRLEDLYG